ncbi:MAG: hypothetical protein NNA23_13485 [Nitrospira sp.]|nr:hypothetical protein [Nitrospira sp.]
MARTIRFPLLAITVVSLSCWTGARHVASAADQTDRPPLVLPDLIHEALARNPELVAARLGRAGVKATERKSSSRREKRSGGPCSFRCW